MRIRMLLVALVVGLVAGPSSAWASPPLPNSIAAIGDSITRATNVCCWYGDHPGQSWSTGDGRFDGIQSHYERVLAANPAIAGRNFNNARAGARMVEAVAQAEAAVAQGAEYVTILMGANDVCTSSAETMTSESDFRNQFEAAMDVLAAGPAPHAVVFVSSIPNVYRLWQLYSSDGVARFVWSRFEICQSMLSAANTEEDRQAVLARLRAFNDVLADVCGQYSNCRFDDYAVFNFQFSRTHVSKLDYFHPSLSGQATLASVTWQHSWWDSG